MIFKIEIFRTGIVYFDPFGSGETVLRSIIIGQFTDSFLHSILMCLPLSTRIGRQYNDFGLDSVLTSRINEPNH